MTKIAVISYFILLKTLCQQWQQKFRNYFLELFDSSGVIPSWESEFICTVKRGPPQCFNDIWTSDEVQRKTWVQVFKHCTLRAPSQFQVEGVFMWVLLVQYRFANVGSTLNWIITFKCVHRHWWFTSMCKPWAAISTHCEELQLSITYWKWRQTVSLLISLRSSATLFISTTPLKIESAMWMAAIF